MGAAKHDQDLDPRADPIRANVGFFLVPQRTTSLESN